MPIWRRRKVARFNPLNDWYLRRSIAVNGIQNLRRRDSLAESQAAIWQSVTTSLALPTLPNAPLLRTRLAGRDGRGREKLPKSEKVPCPTRSCRYTFLAAIQFAAPHPVKRKEVYGKQCSARSGFHRRTPPAPLGASALRARRPTQNRLAPGRSRRDGSKRPGNERGRSRCYLRVSASQSASTAAIGLAVSLLPQ
jgi:hypothetical protein